MKVLNLYAGIGGNRKLWRDVEVTAVEMNPEIAKIYQDFFPEDKVIVGDAHQYLLEHFKEFDFIWSSVPCPTHSIARYLGDFHFDYEKQYPDMSLYQEIIFLQHFAKDKKWNVENVVPYYQPLIPATQIGRHLFWSNFIISPFGYAGFDKDFINPLEKFHGFSLDGYKLKNKRQILRNCVDPELGKHIFECAFDPKQSALFKPAEYQQAGLF